MELEEEEAKGGREPTELAASPVENHLQGFQKLPTRTRN